MAVVQTELWLGLADHSHLALTAEITYSYSAAHPRPSADKKTLEVAPEEVVILGLHLVDGSRREVIPACIRVKIQEQAEKVALDHARQFRQAPPRVVGV